MVDLDYQFSDIKSLYKTKGEDNYLAKIIMYFHWIHQYDRMLKKIENLNSEEDFQSFINLIPNIKLKDTILKDFETINDYKKYI